MKPDIVATVAAITVICYLVGIGCKAFGKIDKWIPVIVGAVGAALGVVGMYTIKEFPAHDVLNALAVGIVSGLAAIHQRLRRDGVAAVVLCARIAPDPYVVRAVLGERIGRIDLCRVQPHLWIGRPLRLDRFAIGGEPERTFLHLDGESVWVRPSYRNRARTGLYDLLSAS